MLTNALLHLLCHLQKARHLLDTMDSALAPLQAQLDAVVNINAPDLLSYAGWMANQAALKQRMEGEDTPAGCSNSHHMVLSLLLAALQGMCGSIETPPAS